MAGDGATMPAAVYRSAGTVDVELRPVPAPGPGQVLVEVGHCGICGSDIHLMAEGWGRPGTIFGHEWSGVVRDVGPDVESWRVGDVVVGGPSPRCGTCRRCREGKPSQCEHRSADVTDNPDGAFAGYVLAGASSLLAVPPGLERRAAALAEPLAVALHGITRSGVAPGDRVVVVGAGPIGALTVAVLVTMGVAEIAVVEPAAARRELAARLGATEVLDPADLEVFGRFEPERLAARAADVVLECSGKKVAIEAGLCQLRRGGTLVLVGAGNQLVELDPNRVLLNELTVTGSFVYDAGGFERALDLLASGAIPTDLVIEQHDVPIDRIGDALTGLQAGTIAGKALVVPRLGDVVERR